MRRLLWLAVLGYIACDGHADPQAPPPGPLAGSALETECVDSPVYALTEVPLGAGVYTLLSFDPTSASFTTLGPIECAGQEQRPLPVLAVDRGGMVYVAFPGDSCGEEWIYRIDPSSMSCEPTPFKRARAKDLDCLISMAFSADVSSPTGESLYFLGNGFPADPSASTSNTAYYLGVVEPSTSAEHAVGPLSGPIEAKNTDNIPLSGGAGGQLFADINEYANTGVGTTIETVDTAASTLSFQWDLPEAPNPDEADWQRQFVSWDATFYLFEYARATGSAEVDRFSPSDASVTMVAPGPPTLAVATSACAWQ